MLASSHDMLVFVCGSQMGKTDSFLMNLIGWKLDEDPQPMLYIGPTEKNVLSISRDRLAPMITSVPSLRDGLARGKADTLTAKYVNGVRIGLGWAGSATEAASHSVWGGIVDEYDRMVALKREGDIVGLVTPRIAAYPDGCIIVTSTPLEGSVETEDLESGLTHWKVSEDVGSPTWSLWQQGTRHEWAWPCPDCNVYHIPRQELLVWPQDATPEQARKEARLVCPGCGAEIANRSKRHMNARGRFVAPGQSVDTDGEIIGEEAANPIASFWASGLASMFRANDFGNLAYKFVVADRSRDDEKLRTVVNTGFGEVYAPSVRDFGWEKVAACGADYRFGEVPDGVLFLVMGTDVAGDRFDYVIRGFGLEFESWLIDRGEVQGQTDRPEVYRDLAKIEARTYGGLKIVAHGIDSGYRADNVYEFTRADPYLRHATKGEDTLKEGVIHARLKERNVMLTRYSTDMAKSWVHARLDWSPIEPGGWHVPDTIDRAYCRQIVSERRTITPKGLPSWKRFGENHKLDCEGIAYIMARRVAPHYFSVQGAKRTAAPKRRRMISQGVQL